MAEKEMINNLIDVYINLQRIDIADDKKKEIDNQISAVKAKLESFGIITSDLTINKSNEYNPYSKMNYKDCIFSSCIFK